MNSLVNLINKLQEIVSFSKLKYKINLPQIICVGAQSSGKTSIIESIVGKDFLPKGTGIVTRRPLILQLKYSKDKNDYCIFNHKPNQIITDFSRVADEIIIETNRIAGRNKAISDEPIILQIFSQNLIDLTLVDLPGLVKVPVGDQPDNIDLLVKKIVLDFISNPNAIILAISPANVDIATSDSLKIAKEVDPYYTRTFGVISKLDLVETPETIVDVINNTTYPLKYGYIGITCRNSKDNFNNKSIESAMQEEEERYKEINEYNSIIHLLGITKLTNRLSEILTSKIKTAIPSIKENLSDMIYKKENELRNLGGESLIESDDIVINTYLLASVFKFSSEYKTLIEGSIVNPNLNKSYIGAANINTLLTQHFKNEITSIDPFDKLTNEEILIVINNTKGLKPSLFIPEDAFEVLVKQQIQRLEEPSLRYVKKIYNELINSLDLIDVKEIKRYKLLESKIKEIMIATINQCLAPTNQMVKNIIQIELSFINSSHPDFLSDGTMKEEMQRYNEVNDVEVKLNCNDLQFSEREIMEINIIRNLIVSYFNVVKKNICDVIPKTIVCFLVNKTKEISEYSMVEKLYKSNEDIKKLLMEDNAVIEKRKEIKDNLSFLKNALLVLEKESNN
jgi:dynamin 1-like protein